MTINLTMRSDVTEQVMGHPEMILDSSTKMNGGWGFFLIERGADFPEGRPASFSNLIDLYFYKEGK